MHAYILSSTMRVYVCVCTCVYMCVCVCVYVCVVCNCCLCPMEQNFKSVYQGCLPQKLQRVRTGAFAMHCGFLYTSVHGYMRLHPGVPSPACMDAAQAHHHTTARPHCYAILAGFDALRLCRRLIVWLNTVGVTGAFDDSSWDAVELPHDFSIEDLPSRAEDLDTPGHCLPCTRCCWHQTRAAFAGLPISNYM